MKEYKDFIPKDDPGLGLWTNNYKVRFPDIGLKVPDVVTDKEMQEQHQLAQEIEDALQNVERLKAELAGAVAHKKATVAKNTRLIRGMAVKIKRSQYYDASIGAALNIVYKGQTTNDHEIKPDIRVVATPDFVQIFFTKRRALGAAIFSRYEGGEWELLGKKKLSPFIDKRPLRVANQPERREYMVRIWDGLKCIGQESSIASVVFGV